MTAARDVTIRPATLLDRAAVEAILIAAKLPTAGVGEIFAANCADFLVAESDDARAQIVAVAGLEIVSDTALLRSVAVAPEWRTRGIGRQLVERIIAHADMRGLSSVYLLTETAEHYFTGFDFKRIERSEVEAAVASTVEFTSACPTSAVVMRRAGRARV